MAKKPSYKSSEKRLNAEKERFRLLVEESPLGILLIDKEEKFKYINPKFIELFGYTLDDIPNLQNWFKKVYSDPQHRRHFISIFKREQRENTITSTEPKTFYVTCKDDTEKTIDFRIVEMENGDKLVICEDITEQKLLESQIQHAQKMETLGTLVAGVAHEINNPINIIMNNAPLLRKIWRDILPLTEDHDKIEPGRKYGGLTAEFLKENLDQLISDIEMAANRVASIVKGLKDFSRKSNPQEKKQIDINTAIENAMRLAQTTLKKSGITIALDLAPELPLIKANLQNLEQIILNLTINAVQAIDHNHGHIKIATTYKKRQGTVEISIKDNGRGIDPYLYDKIFDPFFTEHQMNGGTGLGLSITQNLVKTNDGEISFKSQTGKGTIFYVSFPTRPKVAPNKILLVDDDEAILKILKKALTENRPYMVETASNGTEALIKLGTYNPELLILDVFMPKMDGVELCRAIQKQPALADLQVMIITGYVEHERLSTLIDMGFSRILAKPLIINEFINEVDSVLME